LENVTNLEHMRATASDQNCIREEIKSRLNSRNACYSLVQNIFLPVLCLLV